MFGLDELFDFNHDDELNAFESATQYMAISGEFEEDEPDDFVDEED